MTIGENKEWYNIGIYPPRGIIFLDLIDANVVCYLIGHKSFVKINTLDRERVVLSLLNSFLSPDDFLADRQRVTVSSQKIF